MRDNPNSGYEIFQAAAAVGARVSQAIERFECGSFVIFAPAGALAGGTVLFRRPTHAAGAVTIRAGTVVSTSKGNRDFVLQQDVVFGSLDLGPLTGTIQAIAPGYEWNVTGERLTASGVVLPGEIDTIKALVTLPAYGDITFTVEQMNDTDGGTAPMLEGLGDDRGIVRLPGEPEDSYRVRVRSLPDTVSPDAIIRQTHLILDPYGIEFDHIETWSITYQTCWDAPSPNIGTPTYQATPPANPDFDANLFVYDDPRSEYPLRNVWLDEQEYRGAFIIVLKRKTLHDLGLAYDDPGMVPSDFRDPVTGYGRGTPAYDISASADPTLIFPCAYDGFDITYNSLALSLFNQLQEIKAMGVAAIVERRRA